MLEGNSPLMPIAATDIVLAIDAGPSPDARFNPYQSPSYDATHRPRSTGHLQLVCILAITLGGLGIPAALMAFLGAAVQSSVQQSFMFKPPGKVDPQMERMLEMQEEMQGQLLAVSKRYLPFTLVSSIAHLAVAALLLTGGILGVQQKQRGRKLLLVAFALAVLFELGRAIGVTMVQMESFAIMQQFFERMMEQLPDGDDAVRAQKMISLFTTGISYVVLAVSLAWTLLKVVFYAFGLTYLRRLNIETLFT